ncbi:hypothetical protein [Flagellimonas crocea]|uniref:hypothetical protein n=1 Tax=Flagellimonas crocea TaxID=3067311 RepID=UPI00296F1D71|nr:hypothetical protein [Muricauda sp. DH64]
MLLGACSSSSSPEEVEVIAPSKPNAILPVNGETCSDYIEVPQDESKAIVLFTWESTANATSYLLEVFDGDVVVNSIRASRTDTEATLDKGKSYTWTITAENTAGQTTSDTMSFTTPGEAIANYAPYAAEISTTFNIETSELEISWVGSDKDNDPLVYDITVNTSEGANVIEQTGLIETTLEPFSVVLGETYSISVKSIDDTGNFSLSTTYVEIKT